MSDLYWPAGIADDPLLEGLVLDELENGEWFESREGHERAAPLNLGRGYRASFTFAMTHSQYHGLFLPWWHGRVSAGGCEQGVVPFWMRDPFTRIPCRFRRQKGQGMRTERDEMDYLVTLALTRLPGVLS